MAARTGALVRLEVAARSLALLAFCLTLPNAFMACGGDRASAAMAGLGDAKRGRQLVGQYGCGTCHQIPGVAAADGKVGPPLERIAKRVYLAGRIANTRENMARWIREPQAIDPRTAMPDMQVTEAHARDMVAYLYTLK
jgi:cytochrome c